MARLKTINEALDTDGLVEKFIAWMKEKNLEAYEHSWEKHENVYTGIVLCEKGKNPADVDELYLLGYAFLEGWEEYMDQFDEDEMEEEDFDDGLENFELIDDEQLGSWTDNMEEVMSIYPKQLEDARTDDGE